jgi:hypothetical protein
LHDNFDARPGARIRVASGAVAEVTQLPGSRGQQCDKGMRCTTDITCVRSVKAVRNFCPTAPSKNWECEDQSQFLVRRAVIARKASAGRQLPKGGLCTLQGSAQRAAPSTSTASASAAAAGLFGDRSRRVAASAASGAAGPDLSVSLNVRNYWRQQCEGPGQNRMARVC